MLFVALSAVVLALALAACSEDKPAPAPPPASTQSGSTVAASPAPAPAAPPAGNDQVTSEIKNFALEELTVPVGTTVKWVNKDPEQHTSSSGTPEKPTTTWDSGLMDTDDTFTFTFAREGTFTYFCIVHPDDMRATITVGKPTAAAPQPAPQPTPEPEPAPAASPVDQVTASIANFALPNITVAVGATVKWVNDDAFPHTSSSGVPGAATDVWDSGRLGSGDPFTFTFSEEGTLPLLLQVPS